MRKFFTAFSNKTAHLVGSYWAFLVALFIVIVWGLTGPMFHYSDTWQLFINTGTTVITFLMVFLIQNTQNRDAKAMHLKLDELIVAVKRAHNEMIDIETLDEEQLEEIAAIYKKKKEDCELDTSGREIQDDIQRATADTAQKVAADTAKKVADEEVKKEEAKKVA